MTNTHMADSSSHENGLGNQIMGLLGMLRCLGVNLTSAPSRLSLQ